MPPGQASVNGHGFGMGTVLDGRQYPAPATIVKRVVPRRGQTVLTLSQRRQKSLDGVKASW
eukprot:288450-Prymnesium_polylepis.1